MLNRGKILKHTLDQADRDLLDQDDIHLGIKYILKQFDCSLHKNQEYYKQDNQYHWFLGRILKNTQDILKFVDHRQHN